ncbi:hypothetical protein NDA03_12330 [Trichocoleus sp. Lan]|uniref:hypothetical protein n=1 Tax=Trichocoleus sp. Lan TaxID=2933927 RepID=UPI00329A535C
MAGENAPVIKPKVDDIGDLAPFTWSEAAARPYTVEELVAIAKESLDRTDVGRVEASISNPTLKGNEQ